MAQYRLRARSHAATSPFGLLPERAARERSAADPPASASAASRARRTSASASACSFAHCAGLPVAERFLGLGVLRVRLAEQAEHVGRGARPESSFLPPLSLPPALAPSPSALPPPRSSRSEIVPDPDEDVVERLGQRGAVAGVACRTTRARTAAPGRRPDRSPAARRPAARRAARRPPAASAGCRRGSAEFCLIGSSLVWIRSSAANVFAICDGPCTCVESGSLQDPDLAVVVTGRVGVHRDERREVRPVRRHVDAGQREHRRLAVGAGRRRPGVLAGSASRRHLHRQAVRRLLVRRGRPGPPGPPSGRCPCRTSCGVGDVVLREHVALHLEQVLGVAQVLQQLVRDRLARLDDAGEDRPSTRRGSGRPVPLVERDRPSYASTTALTELRM